MRLFMNVLGIVAEYNPFHNGHLYHLQVSKDLAKADYSICIISGNFSQRGTPSIIDKWSKTQMALFSGIDLILELPTIYSISSAENFANGSIKILNNLNIVTHLSFASEIGNLSILNEFADILYHEPKEYVTLLYHELSKGISYAKARENAMLMYLNDIRKYANIMSKPNNILAIEYLKALKKLKSSITPITIERLSVDHNSTMPSNNIASSSNIRELINQQKDFKDYVPSKTYEILKNAMKYGKIVKDLSTFEKEILYTLRKMSLEEIANLPDVSEGLENIIKKDANSSVCLDEFISKTKSKRYTVTRLQRILLYSILDITKKDMADSKSIKNPYIRILGLNKKGKELISQIKYSNPKLPIITSVKDFIDSNKNKVLSNMLYTDILATNLYTLGYDYDSSCNLDYTKKIISI